MSTNPIDPNDIFKQAQNDLRGPSRHTILLVGGIAALIPVLLYLLDITVSLSGGDTTPGALSAVEWYKVYQDNPLWALRTLGLLNVVSVIVGMPMYCALYAAHKQVNRDYAALAVTVFVVGAAIYIANNAAAPMYLLSSKYVTTTAVEQQTLIAAAGEAILARGEDFTPSSFIGFFLTEIAGLLISFVMLYGRVFSKVTAYTGMVGFALLSIFTVWATFIPVFYNVAMIIAAIGGLASLAWYVLVARQLIQLGRAS